jgi:UrcA family protein
MIIAHWPSLFYALAVLISGGPRKAVMYYGKAFAICGASLIASVAVAGSPRDLTVIPQPQNLVERRIPYTDLNLAAASGKRILNRRIGHKVDSLCNEAVEGTTTSSEYRDCEIEAWRSARSQVSLAVHRAHELASAGSSLNDATAVTIAMPK